MDGISSQMEPEALNRGQLHEPSLCYNTEEQRLMSVPTVAIIMEQYVFVWRKTLAEPCSPRSFRQACEIPDWAAAIDREFNALFGRRT